MTIELREGVQLTDLARGAVIDIETESRHYFVEYLGGDQVRISGHPQWCPTPVVVRLEGSLGTSGAFEPGVVAPGMRLVFQRFDNRPPVTTSEVKDLHVTAGG
jgi:hypothetical protein